MPISFSSHHRAPFPPRRPTGKKILPLPAVALPQALSHLRSARFPVGGLQLDGWWMEQLTLQPDKSLFPTGWAAFRRSLGGNSTGLLLYKAFFAEEYDLFVKGGFAKVQSPTGAWYPAPDDAEGFFTALFRQGLTLGMTAFETDFMSDHMLPTPGLANTTRGVPAYLQGIANAGLATGTPMQWCMPTAGIVLSAVDKPAVTNARASVDYACEGPLPTTMNVTWRSNYQIGNAGHLFWAAGVPPSKDIFRTTSRQPGGPASCGSLHDNPNFELDAVLAVLSTGPVGLGDGVGLTNLSLARRLCRQDGLVLKPSKPITAVDSTFVPPTVTLLHESASSPRPFVGFLPLTRDGDCTATRPCSPALHQTHGMITLGPGYAAYGAAATGDDIPLAGRGGGVGSGSMAWHTLLSIHLGPFRPPIADVYPAMGARRYYFRESRWSRCPNGTKVTAACALPFEAAAADSWLPDLSSGPTRLDEQGAVAWRLFHFAPVLPIPPPTDGGAAVADGDGWTLLGELDKVVPVSPHRFSAIAVTRRTGSGDAIGAHGRRGDGGGGSCIWFRLAGPTAELVVVSILSPSQRFLDVERLVGSCATSACSVCE